MQSLPEWKNASSIVSYTIVASMHKLKNISPRQVKKWRFELLKQCFFLTKLIKIYLAKPGGRKACKKVRIAVGQL
jgi:hypothetical protein